MARLDIKGLTSREVNREIKRLLAEDGEVQVVNPHSVHNFATAVKGAGRITVEGSTGFYTGGFLAGPDLVVKGNTGWYTGDNMSAGSIVVEMNTGSNCAPSMIGGDLVVRGHSGSRCGWGMKGGNLIVCGDAGRWAGKMILGGRLIFLGRVGPGIGESMYNGIIHTRDPEVEGKLGGNVRLVPMADDEKKEVEALFSKYGIERPVEGFMSIVPKVLGRHDYVIFKPRHKEAGV